MPDSPPETFSRALQSLRAARLRPEISCDEAPAPQRLAPFSVALTADVAVGDDELGSGRFVVLHDPDGHESWEGTFRVVTFARAGLDVEMAADPLVTEVGWTWLMECLAAHGLDKTSVHAFRRRGGFPSLQLRHQYSSRPRTFVRRLRSFAIFFAARQCTARSRAAMIRTSKSAALRRVRGDGS